MHPPESSPEARFDEVVASIERSRFNEQTNGRVLRSWPQNIDDPATCVACDWKTICPNYSRKANVGTPSIPGHDTTAIV